MKKLIVFLILITIPCIFCQEKPLNIQGAWKLVYQKMTTPYNTNINTLQNLEIKIYSKSFFSFGCQETEGASAGGGKYTLDGNKYVESIIYFPDPSYINKIITFTMEMKNDTLYQYGIVDSTSNLRVLNKFVRLD
jgi:hypothetical protein